MSMKEKKKVSLVDFGTSRGNSQGFITSLKERFHVQHCCLCSLGSKKPMDPTAHRREKCRRAVQRPLVFRGPQRSPHKWHSCFYQLQTTGQQLWTLAQTPHTGRQYGSYTGLHWAGLAWYFTWRNGKEVEKDAISYKRIGSCLPPSRKSFFLTHLLAIVSKKGMLWFLFLGV